MVSDGIIQPRLRDRHRSRVSDEVDGRRRRRSRHVGGRDLGCSDGAANGNSSENRQALSGDRASRSRITRSAKPGVFKLRMDASRSLFGALRKTASRGDAGPSGTTSQRLYRSNGKGETLFSSCAEITPYLENLGAGLNRLKRRDEHPNREVLLWYSVYYSYGDDNGCQTGRKPFPDTNAMAVTGPGTAFGDLAHPPKSLADVPSGTILIVEAGAAAFLGRHLAILTSVLCRRR